MQLNGAEAALEEELKRQCAEFERCLRQNPLSFENKALEVQLVQMQDDFVSLQQDFKNMRAFLGQGLAEKTGQLEAQQRAAGTAEGHADCLHDLLYFHEEQGRLAGSYWQAQCEKRDDSIRFLTLKLQEYTVPSSDYLRARQELSIDEERTMEHAAGDSCRNCDAGVAASALSGSSAQCDGGNRNVGDPSVATGGANRKNSYSEDKTGTDQGGYALTRKPEIATSVPAAQPPPPPPPLPGGGSGGGSGAIAASVTAGSPGSPIAAAASSSPGVRTVAQNYQAVLEEHLEMCRKRQAQEEEILALEHELEASELDCLALKHACNHLMMSASSGDASEREPYMLSEDAPVINSSGEFESQADQSVAALQAECADLRTEVAACKEMLAFSTSHDRLPAWAHRCTWRDELDVRAGQLERISLEFDETKRNLDFANDELQWQATSAEALRMRLSDALRATKSEDMRTRELRAMHGQSLRAVEELVQQWTRPGGHAVRDSTGTSLPLVVQQAQMLLESIRRSEAAEASATATAAIAA
eukprot:TRINITY_DN2416_c3_g1_i1.p1 TRINITY_DN2416_c3_g1~~TRINITY_DN2416_c3_g1_i1.p1  ORF type:complete len:531 (-),score=110.84 TRINITY_DN2416_c3_g1_i1:217-1809(-)